MFHAFIYVGIVVVLQAEFVADDAFQQEIASASCGYEDVSDLLACCTQMLYNFRFLGPRVRLCTASSLPQCKNMRTSGLRDTVLACIRGLHIVPSGRQWIKYIIQYKVIRMVPWIQLL